MRADAGYRLHYDMGACPRAAISLNLPLRAEPCASEGLHAFFQMNLPEGWLRSRLQSRDREHGGPDPLALLALTGRDAPIGRVRVEAAADEPGAVTARGERLKALLSASGPDSNFEALADAYLLRSGVSGVPPGGALDLTGAVQRPISITGTTTTPVVSVQINQQQAQLGPDGRSFTFPTYFLHEGANHISAVATDAHGRSASDQITVYVDQTAPLLTVESPTPDAVTSLRRVDVRGLVNDAVQAPVETAAPQVRVRNNANGSEVEAVVAGLGYVAEVVLLEAGLNRLEVLARDRHDEAAPAPVEGGNPPRNLVRVTDAEGLVALGR